MDPKWAILAGPLKGIKQGDLLPGLHSLRDATNIMLVILSLGVRNVMPFYAGLPHRRGRLFVQAPTPAVVDNLRLPQLKKLTGFAEVVTLCKFHRKRFSLKCKRRLLHCLRQRMFPNSYVPENWKMTCESTKARNRGSRDGNSKLQLH